MKTLRPQTKKSAALKLILSSINDAYYEIDDDGRLQFFNSVLGEFLGVTEAKLARARLQDFMPEGAADLFDKLLEQSAVEPVPMSFEWELTLGDRRTVLEAGVSLVRDSRGRNCGFRGIIRDITARREAVEEKEAFHSRLLQSQKLESLGILAGGVAHKFNNMLMGILGYAELIKGDLAENSEAHALILELEDTAQRAAELTGQMLAYSGRGTISVEPCDVNKVVSDIEGLLLSTLGNGVSITFDMQDPVPFCQGDLVQLRQIVVNLVTNASESMLSGGELIVMSGTQKLSDLDLDSMIGSEDVKGGDFVFLDVQDSGSGMDGEELERIFDPFYTTKFAGRGLGLPAVLGIVRSHGGAISVKSEKEVGTVVRVYLPVIVVPAEKEYIAAEPVVATTGRVLVVDDEAAVLTVTRIALKRSGYQVTTSDNGAEAVDIYNREWEDIAAVVLDLTMPEMTGEDVFKMLVKVNPHVQVILTSGFTEKEIHGRFEPANIVRFLQKPYKPADLRLAVKKAVSGAHAGETTLDL